jgi:type VI secretion system protein ImpE
MNASDLFKQGKVQETIEAQLKLVKEKPADHGQRLFLFELLAFAGDLDRAQRQIDAVQYGELELDAAVLAYRKILDSEKARRRLFSESLKPRFFGEPSEHIQWRLEGINRLRENRPAEAAELFAKAASACPDRPGQLNGKPFQSLRDCDDLFSGVLEVMAQGGYYWVPLEQVDSLTMNAPKTPRDLLWAPARLEMKESAGNVFLPLLYPNSHEHADSQVKLGRITDWKTVGEGGPVQGVGARVFLVDDDAVALQDWRELAFA